jgi:hypothetical protein
MIRIMEVTAMATTAKERYEVLSRLEKAGISYEHANALRRISMTLSRWGELECGDGNDYCSWSIERDEVTDKPYMATYPHDGKSRRRPVADREKGALKRLQAIMSKYPDLLAYHQTDPRGCAVYVLRKDDVPVGSSIDSVYNRGVAVY